MERSKNIQSEGCYVFGDRSLIVLKVLNESVSSIEGNVKYKISEDFIYLAVNRIENSLLRINYASGWSQSIDLRNMNKEFVSSSIWYKNVNKYFSMFDIIFVSSNFFF